VLRGGEPAVLFLGNAALRAVPLAAAGRIAQKTGARLMAPTSNRRIERGAGRHAVARLPYAVEPAVAALAGVKHLILVGAKAPVAFFAYPDKPAVMYPKDCMVHVLAREDQDPLDALSRLADALDAREEAPVTERIAQAPARGAVTSEAVAQTVSALLPENAVIVDEGVSFGRAFYPGTANTVPHDWLQITGGAIGNGLPLATGAAIGAPGRRIVSLQADGSAMYTVQALWTQAREQLDVTTVILANRKYAILLGELQGVGAAAGKTAIDMLDLSRPYLEWVKIANGMGVEAAQADTMEKFADLFATANRRKGPFLIELVI
jgi:acetolactate synthase-1/2/3 large subunit